MAYESDPIRNIGFAPDLPSSPWATRFPSKLALISEKSVNHSALVPFPRVDDPVYYDQDHVGDHPRNDIEFDKCLISEYFQRKYLVGLLTWEAAVINRHLFFSPNTVPISGGHQPIDKQPSDEAALQTNEERDFSVYQRERIKVDETQWFSFLRKDRWFDWSGFIQDFSKQPRRHWSVDDPRIWEFLRVSLELVNRMLKSLIMDRNEGGMPRPFSPPRLQTLLFGPIDYWTNLEDIFGPPPFGKYDTVLLTYTAVQEVFQKRGQPCPYNFNTATSNEWETKLEFLLSRLVSSFADMPYVEGTNVNGIQSQRQPEYTSVLLMGVKKLELVLGSKVTLGELCTIHVELATTIVHELMHAVTRSRYFEEPHLGKSISCARYNEPFLNAKGYREVGHCMDQYFFGGSPFSLPVSNIFDGFSPSIPPPLGIMISKFDLDCKPLDRQDGAIYETTHTVSSWASRLIGEHFWQDPRYPQKSHRSFHRSALVAKSGKEMDLSSLPYVYDEDSVIVANWQGKQNNWNTWRHNLDARAQRIWTHGPWSSVGSRNNCFRFSAAFSERDLVTCAAAAEELADLVEWNKGVDFMQKPPPIPPRSWLWHCVGLLMMASIPLLEKELENPHESERVSEHKPGREARAAGHNDKVSTRIGGDRPVFAGPSDFCSMDGTCKRPFTQIDYIDRILDISQVFQTTRTVVSSKMLMAILGAVKNLRADRESMVQSMGASHINSWASNWFFELPAYDSALIRYNTTQNKWKFVTPNY